MTEQQYFDLVHIAERLKDNTRHCVTSQGRAESVAEHSWRLAFMAMLLDGTVEGVDLGRVLEMCILHDLGEAITGDIPSFWKTEADEQTERAGVFKRFAKILLEENTKFPCGHAKTVDFPAEKP